MALKSKKRYMVAKCDSQKPSLQLWGQQQGLKPGHELGSLPPWASPLLPPAAPTSMTPDFKEADTLHERGAFGFFTSASRKGQVPPGYSWLREGTATSHLLNTELVFAEVSPLLSPSGRDWLGRKHWDEC